MQGGIDLIVFSYSSGWTGIINNTISTGSRHISIHYLMMNEIARAHELLGTGSVTGKIVLICN
jgi:hypothetical protein